MPKDISGRIAAVETVLEPGEGLLSVCGFIPLKGMAVTAALTNRYIHFVGITGNVKRGYRVTGHSLVPLSAVTTVTTREFGKTLHLTFYWEGRMEALRSVTGMFDEAKDFSEQLKHILAKKEVQKESSAADEIEKLSQLAKEGILSQEELSRAKEMFLGRSPNHVDQSITLLRQLKALEKQGVLSESEFNMKKWDVLSKRDFQ